MAIAWDKTYIATFNVKDWEGQVGTVEIPIHVTSTDTLGALEGWVLALVAPIQAMTNGLVTSCSYGLAGFVAAGYPAVPDAGEYGTVEDRAQITWTSNEDGSSLTLSIPAPKATIFKADTETVDSADSLFVTFNALIMGSGAHAATRRDGQDLKYTRGKRVRSKARTRATAGNPNNLG